MNFRQRLAALILATFISPILSAEEPNYWEDSSGVRHFSRATMEKRHGLWILNLFGNRYEVATQHGHLISDKIDQTAIHYYANRIDRAIEQSPWVKNFPILEGLIKFFVDLDVFDRIKKLMPKEDKQIALQFAQAAGLRSKSILDALVVPDASQWLLAKVFSDRNLLSKAFGTIPGLGCSTFVVPEQNGDTGFIMARNLDYEGAGIFDRNAAVIYVHPDDPRDIPYINFTTLGMPFGAVTAMNAEGIIVSLHQLMIDLVTRKEGTPIMSLTDELIRRSHNLGEAIEIIRNSKHTSTWRLIIASTKENQALVVDTSRKDLSIQPISTYQYAVTNSAESDEMRRKEFAVGYNYYADTRYRHENLIEQLSDGSEVTIQKAVDMISSNEFYNPATKSWEKRHHIGIVGKKSNVQSIIFNPKNSIAYVAVPSVEYGVPLEGSYVPVPTNVNDLLNYESLEESFQNTPSPISRTEAYSGEAVQAHAYYREAAQILSEKGDTNRGVELIQKAGELEPENGNYAFVLGLTYFVMAGRGKTHPERMDLLKLGMDYLTQSEKNLVSDYHRSLLNLFYGRYFSMTGQGSEARKFYGEVQTDLSDGLTRALLHDRKWGYHWRKLKNVVIDYMNVDIYKF